MLMTVAHEKGRVRISLDDVIYFIQYEITELQDAWFKLTIWYCGKSVTERVPRYAIDPHDDVKSPHGSTLLQLLLSET